ncbi:MAG: GntR family transcriptional regulator [Rhodobacteraceae bacterium]|nr:GntR family transcriptional regulator [Paracoccaceae bacterium]
MKFHGVTGQTLNLPASTQVYETLRAQIISLELKPGARLSRSELAAQFGVSASPLREALQRLERDGLVATYRQSRTVVTSIDPGLLQQEHFLRAAVECEVVNALAAMDDKTPLKKAAAIIKMQRVLLEDTDQIDLFRQLDEDFHKELFAAAGQSALHVFASERTSQMARTRSLDLPSKGKQASVVELHEAIIAAILASNRAEATDMMRLHLSGTIARLPTIMAQHPAYFSQGSSPAR